MIYIEVTFLITVSARKIIAIGANYQTPRTCQLPIIRYCLYF